MYEGGESEDRKGGEATLFEVFELDLGLRGRVLPDDKAGRPLLVLPCDCGEMDCRDKSSS